MPSDLISSSIFRFEKGAFTENTDALAVEEPLAVRVNGQTLYITMRTPGNDEELALGFLKSEGFIRTLADISLEEEVANTLSFEPVGDHEIDFSKLTRHVMGSSSCGLCGKTSIDRVRLPFDPITKEGTVSAEVLLSLPEKMRHFQKNFTNSGGIHAAAVFTLSGEPIVCREDIGRHNAVDKVLGFGLKNNLPFHEHILLVSGRASFEILQKSVAGGFPVVAAVSAPSSLAVQFAQETGQLLVGFLRDGRFNVYAGKKRC